MHLYTIFMHPWIQYVSISLFLFSSLWGWTWVLMDFSQICFLWSMMGTPWNYWLIKKYSISEKRDFWPKNVKPFYYWTLNLALNVMMAWPRDKCQDDCLHIHIFFEKCSHSIPIYQKKTMTLIWEQIYHIY